MIYIASMKKKCIWAHAKNPIFISHTKNYQLNSNIALFIILSTLMTFAHINIVFKRIYYIQKKFGKKTFCMTHKATTLTRASVVGALY